MAELISFALETGPDDSSGVAHDNPQRQLARLFEAAGCRTQIELADFLSIRQSSISDAKRRGSLPAEWLIKLLRLKGVHPEWVLTGQGPRKLPPCRECERVNADGAQEESDFVPLVHTADRQTLLRILRCFSLRDLEDELRRRRRTPAEE